MDFENWNSGLPHATGPVSVLIVAACVAACSKHGGMEPAAPAAVPASYVEHDLRLTQELVNDAPIGPGEPQPSDHCPTGPGNWFPGSGRSMAVSSVFGNLRQVEVYCVNTDLSQLSGGLATWTDDNGDTITMTFSAHLVHGPVYEAVPHAPIIGVAQFTGGSGRWAGLTGTAFISGKQNGDGSATLEYRGKVYLPPAEGR